ncbi:MAG: hypothetical protein MUF53_07965 [Gemmatimonadaceae bacterium]|nr:hypothetical protein [Gemmatimonadaceae bacterium]
MSAPDRHASALGTTHATVSGPALVPPDAIDGDDDAKRRRKEQKQRELLEAPLDPFARYKALTDAFKAEQDLVELADKKARFALVIMGALNAAVLLVVTRSPLDETLRAGVLGRSVAVLLAGYAACAIYFFLLAIETLRPRSGAPVVPPGEVPPGASAAVRYNQAIVARSLEAYQTAWQSLRIENLNTELAAQVHVVAGINVRKYTVLSRLYRGLTLMTALVAVLLIDLAAAALLR